jgi:hypothetical protein
MKLLGAALFAFLFIAVGVTVLLHFDWQAPWLFAVLFALGLWLAMVIFSPSGSKPLPSRLSFDQKLEKLVAEGRITVCHHQARRAFEAGELDDEGLHFFVEVDDGQVIYFSGQYLYGFVPCEEEPDLQRKFPCSQFTLFRRRSDQTVMKLECGGLPIEPEFISEPAFSSRYLRELNVVDDGQLVGVAYDQLAGQLRREQA